MLYRIYWTVDTLCIITQTRHTVCSSSFVHLDLAISLPKWSRLFGQTVAQLHVLGLCRFLPVGRFTTIKKSASSGGGGGGVGGGLSEPHGLTCLIQVLHFTYFMTKKSCPIFIGCSVYKIGQDFLDICYILLIKTKNYAHIANQSFER